MATVYQPSGRTGPHAVQLGVLSAIVVIPAAWFYAWLALELHFLAGSLLGLLAGAALGGLAIRICRWGRVRNPAWMGCMGLALGLAFWYSHWVAWATLLRDADSADWPALLGTFARFAVDPVGLLITILDKKNAATLPAYLWTLVSLVELCWLLLMPRAAGIGAAHAVFCEQSGTWALEIRLEEDFEAIADEEDFIMRLEANPHRLATMLKRLQPGETEVNHVSVTLFACAQGDCYVSIDHNVLESVDGKVSFYRANPIAVRLRIPGLGAHDLLQRWAIAPPKRLRELRCAGSRQQC